MCGIAGATGKDSDKLVRRMLEAIKHRGPDGLGTCTIGDITIGNVLLRITGEKNQPIYDGSALTFNGEIYNFRELAQRLNITTDSDSETVFNLILSRDVENAVKEMDGDFAFAFVSGQNLYLARDNPGVKPLHYGKNGEVFAFASEKKALLSAGIEHIHTLGPGHILQYAGGGHTEKKVLDFTRGEKLEDKTAVSKKLLETISHSIEKRKYSPCAIAFSGGLDSSLIASLCDEPVLYSAGMEGSHDITHAIKAAQLLGIKERLHLLEITINDVESAIPGIMNSLGTTSPMQIGIALPLFFASKAAKNDGVRVMLSGQGADELFAGYKRYTSMDTEELEKALEKDLDNIARNNLERDDAVVMANSVELRVPYLDRAVIELASRIPARFKINNGCRKYILRLAAKDILPHDLVWKEKKAAQYSSGIYAAMKTIAKKNGYTGKQAVERFLVELKN